MQCGQLLFSVSSIHLSASEHAIRNPQSAIKSMHVSTPDVLVLGAGPGGYVAAIRASQLGLSTVCVEKDKTLGGTCVNVGCIPSKAMLQSSEHYEFVRNHAAEHGVAVGDVRVDLARMLKRKD